jgi:hypothetical protein
LPSFGPWLRQIADVTHQSAEINAGAQDAKALCLFDTAIAIAFVALSQPVSAKSTQKGQHLPEATITHRNAGNTTTGHSHPSVIKTNPSKTNLADTGASGGKQKNGQ